MTKVVVLEKFKKNWDIGSVVSVKDGYARNYLIPNGKAKFATKQNIEEIKSLEESLLKKDEANKSKANETALIIKDLKFSKEIAYRSKTGFGVPLRDWIKKDLSPIVKDYLSEEKIKARGIFDAKAIRNIINENDSGKNDFSYLIFALLCVEIWFQIFVDENLDWQKGEIINFIFFIWIIFKKIQYFFIFLTIETMKFCQFINFIYNQTLFFCNT